MSIAAIDRPRIGNTAKEWRATCVRPNVSLRDAIRAIDERALQIALNADAEQDCPKPVLPVGSQLILEIILKDLLRQGFSRFFLSTNYKTDIARKRALGLLSKSPKTPLIAMNRDLFTAVNFTSMLEFHVEHRATATTATRKRIVEDPQHSCFINGGVYQRTLNIFFEVPQASNDNAAESPTQGCSDIDRLALLKRTSAVL